MIISGALAARMLGAEQRGHLALFMTLPIAVAQAVSLGVPAAFGFRIARNRDKSAGGIGIVAGLIRWQIATATLIYAALVYAVFRSSADLMFVGLLTVPAVVSSLLLQYTLSLFQSLQIFRLFNLIRILPPLLYSTAIAGLYLQGVRTLAPVAVAWVATTLLVAIAVTLFVSRRYGGAGETGQQGRLVRSGLRMFAGAASPVENYRLDQIAIGLLATPTVLGLYVVGAAFSGLPRLIAQGVAVVVFPRAARHSGEHRRRYAWRAALLGGSVVAATALALEPLVSRLVPALFGTDFVDAVPAAQVLLLGSVAFGVRRILSDASRGAGHTSSGSIAEGATFAILVALIAVLAPYGATGVAVAVSAAAWVGLSTLVVSLLVSRGPLA